MFIFKEWCNASSNKLINPLLFSAKAANPGQSFFTVVTMQMQDIGCSLYMFIGDFYHEKLNHVKWDP